MALTPGARLGVYEVVAPLGQGGMGEVYRARDTKLNRDVALKILPDAFVHDPERLARFRREAQILASLNHPNIGGIYALEESPAEAGHDIRALILELVEGPTLADRIAQGAIPVDAALAIAKQIAEALEAAHEAGVIHRDLKPANVKMRPDGTVKVLDFGLAKASAAVPGRVRLQPDQSASPTITTPAQTVPGMILGTAAYMSPEQARGQPVDKRADIWAFGVVLYEMLAGARTFSGETVPDTLASILTKQVDWSPLPVETPTAVRRLLRRCLERDPRQRLRDIGEARIAIDEPRASTQPDGGTAGSAVPHRAGWRRVAKWALAGASAGALAVGPVVWNLKPQSSTPVARFVVGTPGSEPFSPFPGGLSSLAISPDGTRIVYISNVDGARHLYVRSVDSLEGTRLVNATALPFMSPDGGWVGFASADRQDWRKVSILGGPSVTLFPTGGEAYGATWGRDRTIIFANAGTATGLLRGPDRGGEPEILTIPDADRGELNHWWPEILPDGASVLFTIVKGLGVENMEIAVLDLATSAQKVILRGGSNPRYASSGHIVYGVDGTLRAAPFDLARLEVTGEPALVLEGVRVSENGGVEFSLSANGSLVYGTTRETGAAARTLVWVDRQGREEPVAAPARAYRYPRLSPDGTQVAIDSLDQELDIWIWDVAREGLTRLTAGAAQEVDPTWTPDGRRVVFSSLEGGTAQNLFWKAADGTGTVERLSNGANQQVASSFSPDGRFLLFREDRPGTGSDLRMLSLIGAREVSTLIATEFQERNAELSPDGRWMAYESNESGREEIFVRPFPNVESGRWPISTGGGTEPLWSRDGRELFYRRDTALMAVSVDTNSSFAASTARVLFEADYFRRGNGRTYDVDLDGQRFLMMKEGTASDSAPTRPEIVLVQNWFEELKRLVPTR